MLEFKPTPSEERALRSRAVIIREGTDGDRLLGLLEISAPAERVLEVAFDPTNRVVGPVRSVDIYRQEPNLVAARWSSSLLGMQLQLHMILERDLQKRSVHGRLDPSRPNDPIRAELYYRAERCGAATRLWYSMRTQLRVSPPRFVRRPIQKRGVRAHLEHLRKICES